MSSAWKPSPFSGPFSGPFSSLFRVLVTSGSMAPWHRRNRAILLMNNDVTRIRLYRVIHLFTFSHGGNRNKQGGLLSLMRLAALSSFKSVL